MGRKAVTPQSSFSPTNHKDHLLGQTLGPYRLDGLIATGGMSRIYRAEDTLRRRQVAVKVLMLMDLEQDQTLTRRFKREARELNELEHPNIIKVYDSGEQGDYYYLAMQLVEGRGDLAQELKRLRLTGQRMEVDRALHILGQVAAALDYAHQEGVIHRDVKPSNILLTEDNTAILTDFGLVMRSSVMTTIGTAFGTPRYIAPEQAVSSNRAVPQSDIYSLGVLLYEILTGEPPFNGDTPMEIALNHINNQAPSLREKDRSIPAAVDREVLRALSKAPEARHKSATTLIEAIKHGYAYPNAPSPLQDEAGLRTTVELPITPKRRNRFRPLLALVAVLLGLAAIIGGVIFYANLQTAVTVGAPVTLYYNDSHFTILNGGDYTLDTRRLSFVRGAMRDGGDDFNGDNIPQDDLKANECFRVSLQQAEYVPPAVCRRSVDKIVILQNPTHFFWRRETQEGGQEATFEVRYDGQVIQRCQTISRGGIGECRFNWPVPPPNTEGT
jgi:serine/threonine protein kinase